MYSESMTFKCKTCGKEYLTDDDVDEGCMECAFHLTHHTKNESVLS